MPATVSPSKPWRRRKGQFKIDQIFVKIILSSAIALIFTPNLYSITRIKDPQTSINIKPSFTVMLAPTGDAHQTGRIIQNSFERWIAFECARTIKETIELAAPQIKVVLSRASGDVLEPLQVANFCNRLNADLCISLHFCQEAGIKPTYTLYHYANNTDFLPPPSALSFCPVHRAHQYNQSQTTAWITQLKKVLKSGVYPTQFTLMGPYRMPFAPLKGIIAPAMGIEISLKSDSDWRNSVAPLSEAIITIAGHATNHNSGNVR